MKVFLYLSVTLMIFIALPLNIIGQDAMFQACLNSSDYNESIYCENEKISEIIKTKILPDCKRYKRKYLKSKINLTFNIKHDGIMEDIKITEISKFYPKDSMITAIQITDNSIQDFNLYSKSSMPENYISRVFYQIANYNSEISDSIFSKNVIFLGPQMKEFRDIFQMPRFPGCEDLKTEAEKDYCAKNKLFEYINNNLVYPDLAKKNGIEGIVVIQFYINYDGSISDINIVRDRGYGCGQSAYNVVETMNDMPERWIPGRQRGRPVRVLYTLPVKFKL